MLSLTSALDGGGWLVTRLGRLSPGERPGTHYIGGCMGPNAGLDVYGKYRPHRDFFFFVFSCTLFLLHPYLSLLLDCPAFCLLLTTRNNHAPGGDSNPQPQQVIGRRPSP